jgi:hypothetical protein
MIIAMVDVLLRVLVAFFALGVLLVKACERIIGPDVEETRFAARADDERVAA